MSDSASIEKHRGAAPDTALRGAGLRFGIAMSRYNEQLCRRLVDGACDSLLERGVARSDLHVREVPGAWELPLALRWIAVAQEELGAPLDGLVAIGIVIRGGTPHFEYVCRGCTDGCLQVALELDLPVGFGVLTCDDADQAAERCGGVGGNKGEEAALAALEMASLRRQLSGAADTPLSRTS